MLGFPVGVKQGLRGICDKEQRLEGGMPFRKMLLGLSVVLLCATASVGQKKTAAPAPQVDPASKLQGLDDLAAQAMQEWKVPGLAIGIVKDGRVIYANGYGFRDVQHKLPVTTD